MSRNYYPKRPLMLMKIITIHREKCVPLRSCLPLLFVLVIASWPCLAQGVDINGLQPQFKRLNTQSRKTVAAVSSPNLYYNAQQIGKIYNILPVSGTAKASKIGIVELGGGYRQSDLTTYWNKIGLTPSSYPKVTSFLIDGATNNPADFESSTEVTMDTELVGGIAPGATINVYFAPNSSKGFYDAIAKAITDNCKTILTNWGAPENSWGGNTVLVQFDSLFQTAVNKGITIVVSSGTAGSTDGTASNMVDFPASSPNVTAVGGTSLYSPNYIYDSSTTETVWNNNPTTSSSGGGYSSYFSAPSYQTTNLPNFGNKRGIPDVSAVADPTNGVLIYQNGQYVTVGGSNAGSAVWAAYIAQLNLTTFLNNVLYKLTPAQIKSGFHDITSGNNGGYAASVGWDPVTGFGSPNGSMLSGLLAPLVTVGNPKSTILTLTTTGDPLHLGQSVTLTATVYNRLGIPTGSVDFYDGDTLLGSGILDSCTATYTTATLSLGAHTLTAEYTGDGNYLGNVSPGLDLTVLAPAVAITQPSPITLRTGTTGETQLTLSSLGTLTGPITFSVTGLPTGASYELSSPSITVQGGPTSVTLRILTTGPPITYGSTKDLDHTPWGLGAGALLAGGLIILPSNRRKRLGGSALLVLVVVGLLGLLTACGENSTSSGTTPVGTYEVTVTASSQGATDAVTTLQLTVTP